MDKYTIHDYQTGQKVLKDGNIYIADFDTLKDAQEYIAWKNQPKIRTEIKNAILSLIYECIGKSEAGVGEMFIDAIKEIEKWKAPEPIKFKIMSPTEEN